MMRRTVRMAVVAEPDDPELARVFALPRPSAPGAAFLEGHGRIDCVCGHCGRVLMRRQRSVHRVPGLLFRCPACGSCNAPTEGPVQQIPDPRTG
ncbi:hypothetical protein GIS00_13435 [Nakamurella sp. YIM 132087]|uniref:Uncharacterized protein n=1 Tax=Nakamurella alba TaxID=2665158 RepID=A0A7K1FLB8_9ACTN|nr:hypothetical protein [Nakamurella alba]MTD14942.1 hypothetical protein [Nakamurella alba]